MVEETLQLQMECGGGGGVAAVHVVSYKKSVSNLVVLASYLSAAEQYCYSMLCVSFEEFPK